MPSPARLFKTLAATALTAALAAWLLAPEAARLAPALASWTAWKQARGLDLAASRDVLDALSGAVAAGTETSWGWPAAASGTSAADPERLAWDRATLDALSGAWTDAAAGFARAAGTGSSIPPEEAFFQLGNALYRLGESGEGGADKAAAWALAVASYGKSLAARYTDDAWNNREFVLGKLREEMEKRRPQDGQSQPGQDGQGPKAGPDDARSLEQLMRDAARRDQELRKWLRPDGKKPARPSLPSELLRDLMGGDGGAGEGEKKDW